MNEYRNIEKPTSLENCHTEEDLKKIYPNAVELYSKFSFAFWQLEKNLFMKIFYFHKNGKSMKDLFDSGVTSYKGKDVVFDKFVVDNVYVKTGTHKEMMLKENKK